MAKEEKGGKIRVIVVELEGSNETIQESLRTVASALGRSVVYLPTPSSSQSVLASSTNAQLTDALPQNVEPEWQVEQNSGSTVPTPNKSKKKRVGRTPQLLDIDTKAGDPPLAQFVAAKKPESARDRYMVIAKWLKQALGVTTIGQDHIFTCYRSLGWNVLRDIGHPFRDAKVEGYFKSVSRGMYELSHVGEDRVSDMG